jgi:hypothetical protein
MKGKSEVVPAIFLTEHHSMKVYWGSGGIAPRILDLGTKRRWVVSFTPRLLYPRERTSRSHCRGGWVGPTAGLDAVVKKKIPSPYRTWTRYHPAHTQRYTAELAQLISKGWKEEAKGVRNA